MKKDLVVFFNVVGFCCFYLNIQAQKLPNTQTNSLRVPFAIKIDGKANEWDNKFQAYNHATDVFYTLSNDDANLYLTLRATDKWVINKIYGGGLLFILNASKGNNEKENVTITYPVWEGNNKFHINVDHKPDIKPDSPLTLQKADSFMNAANESMIAKAKTIRIGGIKGIDSLISVYNENNIKAAALFNNQMAYTLELAIPLKYLNADINTQAKINYHIELLPLKRGDNTRHLGNAADDAGSHNSRALTDFSGEYILAKKQEVR